MISANLLRNNYTRDQIRKIVMKARNAQIEKEKIGFDVTDLVVNGNDIMTTLNIGPGKLVGDVLKHLLEIVIDDPEKNALQRLVDKFRK